MTRKDSYIFAALFMAFAGYSFTAYLDIRQGVVSFGALLVIIGFYGLCDAVLSQTKLTKEKSRNHGKNKQER